MRQTFIPAANMFILCNVPYNMGTAESICKAIKFMHGLIRCSALVCVKANHEHVLKRNLLEQTRLQSCHYEDLLMLMMTKPFALRVYLSNLPLGKRLACLIPSVARNFTIPCRPFPTAIVIGHRTWGGASMPDPLAAWKASK